MLNDQTIITQRNVFEAFQECKSIHELLDLRISIYNWCQTYDTGDFVHDSKMIDPVFAWVRVIDAEVKTLMGRGVLISKCCIG